MLYSLNLNHINKLCLSLIPRGDLASIRCFSSVGDNDVFDVSILDGLDIVDTTPKQVPVVTINYYWNTFSRDFNRNELVALSKSFYNNMRINDFKSEDIIYHIHIYLLIRKKKDNKLPLDAKKNLLSLLDTLNSINTNDYPYSALKRFKEKFLLLKGNLSATITKTDFSDKYIGDSKVISSKVKDAAQRTIAKYYDKMPINIFVNVKRLRNLDLDKFIDPILLNSSIEEIKADHAIAVATEPASKRGNMTSDTTTDNKASKNKSKNKNKNTTDTVIF